MVGFDMGCSRQGSNGFELLRVLTLEFSLRTRAEAFFWLGAAWVRSRAERPSVS